MLCELEELLSRNMSCQSLNLIVHYNSGKLILVIYLYQPGK
jgi:hypothetical protein